MPVELMGLLHNLKEHDFEVSGNYKIDENEAKRIITAIEVMQQIEMVDKAQLMRMIEDL